MIVIVKIPSAISLVTGDASVADPQLALFVVAPAVHAAVSDNRAAVLVSRIHGDGGTWEVHGIRPYVVTVGTITTAVVVSTALHKAGVGQKESHMLSK